VLAHALTAEEQAIADCNGRIRQAVVTRPGGGAGGIASIPTRHRRTTEEDKMMWSLLVFASIGVITGAAARMLYPGRQPARILGTVLLGALGAAGGGLLSWAYWPSVDDTFHSGNLLLSFLGAVLVIVLSAGVAYARSLSVQRNPSP
jgi:uncharacterized membrane protein YeaQ/YmgE (transglycosylase-associated protein family)